MNPGLAKQAMRCDRSQMHIAVLIVAAGRGTRAGEGLPKQYRRVGGIPLIRRTLDAFTTHLAIIHPDDVALYEEAVASCTNLLPPAYGGATRQASVLAGLEALTGSEVTHVLIHDGARAFVDASLISRVIDALKECEGALPSLPVTDTLRQDVSGHAGKTIDRSGLIRAQTPQGFAYEPILAAHRAATDKDFTDDVALASAAGLETVLVAGSEENFKVTEPYDFDRAERQVALNTETRVGSGFDVHRFCAGEKVTLCGVEIAHTHGLLGHSDADVAMHALTDALLGAIGEGDIGDHFPPSDPKWKGAASWVFLKHAADLLRRRAGRIVNIDLTIICETPKIGPHRDRLRQSLADILEIEANRISVKATTTEGLGFTGRGEGIATQATATVSLPIQAAQS